jgi:DNA-binding beta-propeller fold protein YncE
MKGNITDIQDAITSSNAHKGALDFTRDNGSDQQTFLLVHSTKGDINHLQHRVLNLTKIRRHVSLEFFENTKIHSSLNNLGSMVLLQGAPLCNPFLSRKLSQSQIQIATSRLISSFTNQSELNLQRIHKNCDIRGMAVSNDGTLLLCDCANRRLILFNSDGNYESTISTKYSPWDIAVIPGTQSAVVSKRDEGCIQFIDIENKTQLQVVSVCENRSGGLGATTDFILIGGEGKIYFLNLHGQFVKSVDVEVKSAIWYLAPFGNDIICCSSSIDADVHVINMQNGDNKFYGSKNLKTPMKMAPDDTGNIYVVGHSSDNILRLSPNDGTFSVVLTANDGIKHPCALCFNKDFTKLYVSSKMGKEVTVFTVNR